jgi:hypothetical protein
MSIGDGDGFSRRGQTSLGWFELEWAEDEANAADHGWIVARA